MRKLLAFLLTLAMVTGMLSGCAGVPVAVEKPQGNVKEEVAAGEAVKTGLYVSASLSAENAAEEANGTTTTDISIIAVTVNDSGVIESCAIDAIQGKVAFDAKGQIVSELGEVLLTHSLKSLFPKHGRQYLPMLPLQHSPQRELTLKSSLTLLLSP